MSVVGSRPEHSNFEGLPFRRVEESAGRARVERGTRRTFRQRSRRELEEPTQPLFEEDVLTETAKINVRIPNAT
jgi:hypothetical protein